MIVGLTGDQSTAELAAYLIERYPNDAPRSIQNFLVLKNKVQREEDGSLPERITFVGHGSPFKFGSYPPEVLADYILEQLKEAATIEPDIKKSLTKLDFIACNIGAMRHKGENYLVALTKRLQPALEKEGFNINVMGFNTEKLNEQGQKSFSTLFNVKRDKHDNASFQYYACAISSA